MVSSGFAADLYCGSGSVTSALKAVGFSVAFAVDNDKWASQTFRENHPDVNLIESDIREIDIAALKSRIGLEKIDVLTVCAPCQPFSLQNRHRDIGDVRAGLVLQALRFAKEFDVQTVWVENVPGLANSAQGAELRDGLRSLGFDFSEPLRIDAAELGVPQRRVRSVFVASKQELPIQRLDSLRAFRSKEKLTVRDAFEGLGPAVNKQQLGADPLHYSRNHSALTLERLSIIPQDGGSRDALPDNLQLSCHKAIGKRSFPDVYGRMAWDRPAPTLTTGCTDVTRGRFAHPTENRAITLREAARLQSFPDYYKFSGNHREITRIIGNAVPMEMARRIFQLLFFGAYPEAGAVLKGKESNANASEVSYNGALTRSSDDQQELR